MHLKKFFNFLNVALLYYIQTMPFNGIMNDIYD